MYSLPTCPNCGWDLVPYAPNCLNRECGKKVSLDWKGLLPLVDAGTYRLGDVHITFALLTELRRRSREQNVGLLLGRNGKEIKIFVSPTPKPRGKIEIISGKCPEYVLKLLHPEGYSLAAFIYPGFKCKGVQAYRVQSLEFDIPDVRGEAELIKGIGFWFDEIFS